MSDKGDWGYDKGGWGAVIGEVVRDEEIRDVYGEVGELSEREGRLKEGLEGTNWWASNVVGKKIVTGGEDNRILELEVSLHDNGKICW